MNINFFPPDYRFANEMKLMICNVLQNHPLSVNILTPAVLKELTINVDVDFLDADKSPEIGCREYPQVKLCFGSNRYSNDGRFDSGKFRLEILHEFVHLIDRRNLGFGITEEKEKYAKKLSEDFSVAIHMDSWNCYINGRLWRKGIRIQSLEEFVKKRYGNKIRLGNIDKATIELLYKKAWDSDQLTFDEIIELTKRVVSAFRDCPTANK